MVTSTRNSSSADHAQNQDDSQQDVQLESLFDFSRCPPGWKFFVLCVYFPLGIILAALRLFIGLHVFILSIFLRHSVVGRQILRIMCVILGIVVTEEGQQQSSRVIVANHLSPFDFIAVALTRSCVLPTIWDAPGVLQKLFGLINLRMRVGRETLIKNAKGYLGESGDSSPLLTFPEGAMANGKIGLLKFNSWPFSLDTPIQPLVIQLRRPEFSVAPTTVGSGLFADTFWLLCMPFTVFNLRWLPEMKADHNETPDSFARKVEAAIAHASDLNTTRFTSHDAFEFVKRRLSERNTEASVWHSGRPSHPYDHLASAVKEIVPQVPRDIILNELERTHGSIDQTISNILEGRVKYTPEQPQSSNSAQMAKKPMQKVSTNDPSSWRDLYEIRKQEMLETNRRAYLARKGYNLRSRDTSS